MTDNLIEPDLDWQQNRREDGTYFHPTFFSEENAYDESKWDALLEKYNLDTHYMLLGDNYPRFVETKLRELYDSAPADGWEAAIRNWVPSVESTPMVGEWFILSIYDSEDGPYCVWVCVKSEKTQPEIRKHNGT